MIVTLDGVECVKFRLAGDRGVTTQRYGMMPVEKVMGLLFACETEAEFRLHFWERARVIKETTPAITWTLGAVESGASGSESTV